MSVFPPPPNYEPSDQPYRHVGTRREPALVLIFSLLTCGIYYLYWLHMVSYEIQAFLGDRDTDPGMEVFLAIITCGIYIIFWDYKVARKLAMMQQMVGLMPQDNSTLFVVLDFVDMALCHVAGVGIIPAMIEQGTLNDVWAKCGANRL
jgi:hypothetical protein